MKPIIRIRFGRVLYALTFAVCGGSNLLLAATFGIDNRHGFDAADIMTTGSAYQTFRSVITGLGHTIAPLNSFGAADLAGIDAVILKIPYSQNGHVYSGAEIAAIKSFANRKAIFLSDGSIWRNDGSGSDRPISFGDNQKLLSNILGFTSSGRAAIFVGDNGNGFEPANMNSLVAAYGVSYSASPTDGDGRTVSGFVPHSVTAGLAQIGVDFQLPLTVSAPSIDLTTGGGQDNVLAVFFVPEPTGATLAVVVAVFVLMPSIGRSHRTRQT